MASIWRWLTWQRVPIAQLHIARPRFEALFWAGFALLYVALSAATGLLIRWRPLPLPGAGKFTEDLWYLLLFKVVGLLLVPCALLRWQGYRIRDLLEGWAARPRTALTLALAAVLGLLPNLGYLPGIGAALAEKWPLLVPAAVIPLLCAALPEEIVYRGLLQTRLEATIGRLPALILASLLFAAWHLPSRYLLSSGAEGNAGDLVSVMVGTGAPVFVAGLVFGWAWDRWRSLPHLVLAHWAVDLLPGIGSFLGVVH